MADQQSKADAVAKAQKQKKQAPIKGPDIYVGGPAPLVPFAGDPKKNRPNKQQTRDEIDAIRKSGVPDSDRNGWMNNPKVASRTKDSI